MINNLDYIELEKEIWNKIYQLCSNEELKRITELYESRNQEDSNPLISEEKRGTTNLIRILKNVFPKLYYKIRNSD